MSFHCAAFYGSIGATPNSPLNPNSDGLMSIQNNKLTVPAAMRVMGAQAIGALLTDARLNIPSLRSFSLPRVWPVANNATAPSYYPMCDWRKMGPMLTRTEGITMEVSNSGAGPTATHGLIWLMERFMPVVGGEIITVKATASVSCNVGAWTAGSMTLEQDLPAGRYQLIGAAAQGTNLLALRFRIPMQDYIPGVPAQDSVDVIPNDQFRFGNAGVFGEFDQYNLPSIECVGVGANSAQAIYMDLIKVK